MKHKSDTYLGTYKIYFRSTDLEKGKVIWTVWWSLGLDFLSFFFFSFLFSFSYH